ncbi:FAD-dependent monooxygenase [Streptomyces sp. NPDC004959]|uniref:FAD-dependent monooxygenase n=1 Tax=Streptomyces sp. NPDC004959 TaxID=3154673 RepID=UPI0033AD38A3
MNHAAPEGPLAGKTPVPVRGVVHVPVSDGRRYLLGDAAHLVPPRSARGMNLAASPAPQGPSGRAVRVRVPTGIRPPRTRVLIHRCTGPGRQERRPRTGVRTRVTRVLLHGRLRAGRGLAVRHHRPPRSTDPLSMGRADGGGGGGRGPARRRGSRTRRLVSGRFAGLTISVIRKSPHHASRLPRPRHVPHLPVARLTRCARASGG